MTSSLDTARRPAVSTPTHALVGDPLGRAWTASAAAPVRYEVRIAPGLLDPDNTTLDTLVFSGASRRRLVVVDEQVFTLHGDALLGYLRRWRIPAEVVCFAVEESRKGVEFAVELIGIFDEVGLDRRGEPVVAVGGGVLLDAVGCAAGLYRRGIPYVRIPTTLIGLVDAGIGVKTGVNHNSHKNRVGSYHPPVLALLDPGFLRTLPARHVSNGLAEIAKMGLVCEADLWALLAQYPRMLLETGLGATDTAAAPVGHEVMSRAVHSMLVQLTPNLWEHDLDRLVDFGHTFSPTLEMAALPDLLHGEAVAIDMALCCAISTGRGLLPERDLRSILATFRHLGLPLTHPAGTPALLERALADSVRHRGGRQRLPVPVRPGHAVFLNDITPADLTRAHRKVRELADQQPC